MAKKNNSPVLGSVPPVPNPDENTQEQPSAPNLASQNKMPPSITGTPVMPSMPQMPLPVAGMANGGMLQDGGLLQEGGTVDEESGNEVPTGSLQEEVRDDIPAQLSEGEFVFPADVVRFIGLERLMQLRQIAKEGLQQMEAMGQMGNSEEATMEDTAEFETEIDDIIKEIEMEGEGEEEEEEEPQKMQEGGMPSPMPMQDQMQKAMPKKGDKLPPQEIIKRDLSRRGFTQEEQTLMKQIVALVRLNKATMVQINNTVFVGLRMQSGSFKVHLFSLDSPNVLVNSIEEGINFLKKSGVKSIQSTTQNYQIISLLKTIGYFPEVKKQGNKFSFTMEIE